MGACRPVFLAGVLAALVGACGSNPSAPSNASAQATCSLTNGKVLVVIGYVRDRAKVSSSGLLSFPPSLVLVDFGGPVSPSSNPQLTRIDDYTWTTTVLVTPNADPMSHGASIIDVAAIDPLLGPASIAFVTGVTANGVQVRKVTFQGQDLGYFGVDVCGKIFV